MDSTESANRALCPFGSNFHYNKGHFRMILEITFAIMFGKIASVVAEAGKLDYFDSLNLQFPYSEYLHILTP